MKRKLWIIPVLAALIALLACGAALAAQSGSCGDNLTWKLSDAGELTVTGIGQMTEYSFDDRPPWYDLRSSVKSIVIGNRVTSISKWAFEDCSAVTGSVIIPASVTEIGYVAFFGCSGLREVTVLNKDAVIGDTDLDVFQNCAPGFILRGFSGSTALAYAQNADISFAHPKCGSGLTWDLIGTAMIISGSGTMTNYSTASIPPWNDLRENITDITVLSGVKSIGNWAFGSFHSLTAVNLPAGMKSIGAHAFSSCDHITGITIPDSVTDIGANAFEYSLRLAGVTVPKSVTSIGGGAFRYCNRLEYAEIFNPGAVFGSDVFLGTPSGFILRGYRGSTAEAYADENGHIFEPLSNMSAPDFILPDDLTHIEAEAFAGAKMTVVYIPDGVKSIGSRAFANCTGLTQIRIPASVTVIAEDAFQGVDPSQLTIFGASGSAAETFAGNAGISFETE